MADILCTITLSHIEEEKSIRAEIRSPVQEVTYPKGAPETVTDWACIVLVKINESRQSKTVWSANWPGAILLALDYIRSFIPAAEERKWVDADGVESWCVLPKLIPTSWGYHLYSQISSVSDQLERDFTDGVQQRRLEWERRQNEVKK